MIRDAVAADAETLAALYEQLLGLPADPAGIVDAIGQIERSPYTRLLVCEIAHHVVGTVQACFYPSPLRATAGKGIIDAVVIDTRHRGRGHATRLIAHASAWLRAAGVAPVFVATRADRSEGQRLYASLGWSKWGVTYASFEGLDERTASDRPGLAPV